MMFIAKIFDATHEAMILESSRDRNQTRGVTIQPFKRATLVKSVNALSENKCSYARQSVDVINPASPPSGDGRDAPSPLELDRSIIDQLLTADPDRFNLAALSFSQPF